MKKSLQFELWQECNSKCTYCYLGDNNLFTPKEVKLNAIHNTLDKISDMSIYEGEDGVKTLSYLGGEFFQGQLNDPEVRDAFFALMKKTADLYNTGAITSVWIYATMTIGDQQDLYDTIDLFDTTRGDFWILTSYDTIGRFHTEKMKDTWESNIAKIHKTYPNILINTTMIITQDLINKYLMGEFLFSEFSCTYGTSLFFKHPGYGTLTQEEMTKRAGSNFFPKRADMLRFLHKLYDEEGPTFYTKLFNIEYRADDLYRNFNDIKRSMKHTHRDKTSRNEEQPEWGEVEKLPCGDLKTYATYADSDACIICDMRRVLKMKENNLNRLAHE